MTAFASAIGRIDFSAIQTHVLDVSPESPLYETNVNGAYVILPKSDRWESVRQIAANVFYDTPAEVALVQNMPKTLAQPRVEIQNGSGESGLAFVTSQLLMAQGFEVIEIGNAQTQDYTHTVIYDFTDGEKAEALGVLKELLFADVSMSPAGWVETNKIIPTELTAEQKGGEELATEKNLDFLIILGANTSDWVAR
jgi:hypothetical protein